jgi:hypothetical protein
VQRRAAGRQQRETRGARQDVGDERRGSDHPLAIVQDEQQPLAAEHPDEAVNQPPALLPHAEPLRDRGGHQNGVLHHAQIDEPDTVRKDL